MEAPLLVDGASKTYSPSNVLYLLLQTENKTHFSRAHCIAALQGAATAALCCPHELSSQRTGAPGERTKRGAGGRVYQSADDADDRIEGWENGERRSHPSACRTPLSSSDRRDELLPGLHRDGLLTETSLSWRRWEMCLCFFSPSNLRPCICVLCGAFKGAYKDFLFLLNLICFML